MLPEELQYHNTEINSSKGAKLNTLKVLTVLELFHDLEIFLNVPQGGEHSTRQRS